MRYVVMVSHGTFATGLHAALKMMVGERFDVYSICMTKDMDAEDFVIEFNKIASSFCSNDEVILLSDILSGSPFSNAINILGERNIIDHSIVLAGMNMPMGLTAILKKDILDNLEDLKKEILAEGHAGLTDFIIEEDDEVDFDL